MEPVQPFQMNIYKSNTYRKYLSWLHFGNEPRVQERQQMEDQRTCISVFVACPTNPVFHAWPYGRFIEIKNNLRKKKHIINQGSNLLGWSYSNIDNVIVPIQFRRECQPQHLKILFFHKNGLVMFPQHWNQQVASCSIPQCLIAQIQAQMPILVVATDQIPDHI